MEHFFTSKTHTLSYATLDEMLPNDEISSELDDKLSSSYNVPGLNLNRFRKLSSGRKLNIDYCLEVSIILPRVQNLGF